VRSGPAPPGHSTHSVSHSTNTTPLDHTHSRSRNVMASMDERQYERFAAFNSARLNNRPLKKVGVDVEALLGLRSGFKVLPRSTSSAAQAAQTLKPSHLYRPLHRQLVSALTGSDKLDPLLLLALGSITKAFLGELVEHGEGVKRGGGGTNHSIHHHTCLTHHRHHRHRHHCSPAPSPARIIAARQGHKGALLPGHIRQAYAQLEADRRTPHSRGLRKPLR